MIAHTGTSTRDIGPRCNKCQIHAVRFEGATCSVCRGEERKEREFLWAFFFFVLVMAALMMAASSALGTWMALNVDGFGSHGRVNPPAYAGLVQPRGGMTLSAPANNLGDDDGR
jgi:hypothetical protein